MFEQQLYVVPVTYQQPGNFEDLWDTLPHWGAQNFENHFHVEVLKKVIIKWITQSMIRKLGQLKVVSFREQSIKYLHIPT